MRGGDDLASYTLANGSDGDMRLSKKGIAREGDSGDVPHGRICITCEGSGWRMAMAAAFSVAEFVSVRKGGGWRSVATTRAKAL